MVNERGIEVDQDKIRAILAMPAPRTEREVRGFLGRLQYISRFIARLIDIYEPLFRLLRKSQPIVWDDQCQRAFERIREYLLSPPFLAPPIPGRPLLLYLSKSIRESIVTDHLASLPASDARAIDDDFPDEDIAVVTSLSGWRMYFDGAANYSGYGIGILLISPHDDHIPRSVRLAFSDRHPATNNIVEYEACILGLEMALELGIRQMELFGDSNLQLVARFDDLRYTHLPRAQNQFADALATLASMITIPTDAIVRPLLIESRSAPVYCCLINDVEPNDDLPWYQDIYHFLSLGVYPEAATTKDRRALRQLATRFVICDETLYKRSPDGMLLLCLDRASADRVMREFVQRCPECLIHGDLIHVPPSELHALTSPWPFLVWGIDIIGKISPKSSSGHEFILVAIDYFTKWVEAASYARLTSSGVASFIRSHIICRYGVPHELISNRGVHFRAEVDALVQRHGIRHHRSSTYRPQTNEVVEAANKNIKRILRKMAATPYSLVYGMEAVLPVEIEMGSLRVALEQQIPETEWAQARFDQLNLLDERRLRAADHVRAYQRKMARAFKKRVKPRPLYVGDLVLRVIRGLIRDPRGKFRPSWSRPYFIRELSPEGAAWLMDLDGNQFSEPTNVDQLKSLICFICLLIDTMFTLGTFGSLAHGIYYTCCISYRRAWILIIGYRLQQPLLEQVFEIRLPFGYRHAFSSGRHLSDGAYFRPDEITDHEGVACLSLFARFAGIDDLSSSDFSTCYILDATLGHIPHFGRGCGDPPLVYMIIHGYEIHTSYVECLDSHVIISVGTHQPWRRSFSHMSVVVSITRPRYIVFASLTIIPELFIDMSSQWSVVQDS
ncbi:Pol polyprotein [Vitis vinifera]|uniref:Pol polyprotein n=1 Tax=Vitis vinifera TaxID=29760 RepID=A0A438GDN1_VITVI|nr:Pol polyprotein [Vitis vinifera]